MDGTPSTIVELPDVNGGDGHGAPSITDTDIQIPSGPRSAGLLTDSFDRNTAESLPPRLPNSNHDVGWSKE